MKIEEVVKISIKGKVGCGYIKLYNCLFYSVVTEDIDKVDDDVIRYVPRTSVLLRGKVQIDYLSALDKLAFDFDSRVKDLTLESDKDLVREVMSFQFERAIRQKVMTDEEIEINRMKILNRRETQ